ncbi:MAG: DNA primase [Anaerolineae bacterium]|nr:DNA primase [Anaerolineae bacterium]
MSAVDEIKARLDIADVISSYIPLKRAGRNYKGICPFHSEKTPSFIVFPETQSWHCFGACGTGGDLFSFVMKYENLDFGEALKSLAQKAGVTLETPRQGDLKRQKHLEKLYDIHATAAAYFHETLLKSPHGQPGRDYSAQRGLNEETIQRFQLGFARDDWRALSNHLLERGYERQDLLECGLIIPREDGGFYDRFRGRFMIPIRDIRGQVIGFGGRVIGPGEPKYLNSPQTPLFDKSHILFGIDLAKGAIRARNQVVIVEGYMDVLQAHQAGIGNVVASMGTALTEHQLNLLKRMTKNYILALDPDAAGDQGTLRGLAVARQTLDKAVPIINSRGWIRYESRLDADIRIMTLPEGKDPDDLIRETPELWNALVESAMPVVDYYFDVITADLDTHTAKGKSEAVRRLLPILLEISDQVQQTHYIQKLARLVRMEEPAIRRQLNAFGQTQRRRPLEPDGFEPKIQAPVAQTFALEEQCLSILLRRPEWLDKANKVLADLSLTPLQEDDFAQVENRALFAAWQRIETGMDWQTWVDQLPPLLQLHLDFLLDNGLDVASFSSSSNSRGLAESESSNSQSSNELAERDFERNILHLRRKNIDRVIQNLQVLQAESLEQGDARAVEYQSTVLALLNTNRFGLDRALHENTALGRRQKRERVA